MLGEVQHDPLGIEFLDCIRKQAADFRVAQLVRRRKLELGLEPAADRQHGGPFPSEHRGEKLVFLVRRHMCRVEHVDRLVKERLELVPQAGIEQQLVDFVGVGAGGSHDGVETCSVRTRLLPAAGQQDLTVSGQDRPARESLRKWGLTPRFFPTPAVRTATNDKVMGR
jgi:hypothetical protein